MNWKELLLPLGVFIGILLMTYFLRSVFFRYLLGLAKRTKWPFSEIVIKVFKKFIPFWGLLLALHISLGLTRIPPHIFTIINKTLLILLILSLAMSGSRLLVEIFNYYVLQKSEVLSKITLFEILVKIFVYVIAGILILNVLNINIAPFITTLGIAGLAISLALKDTLENFFAGIHIIMSKQIKPGDFLRLESGDEGIVEDITWRNTTLRTLSNNLIIIPNSKLAQSKVINYHLPSPDLSVIVEVGVSYESDLERVERITLEVARELMKTHPDGVPDFEPLIRYTAFRESSINFNVILRSKEPTARFVIAHEFIKRLHKRYKEEGIEIPFPIRTVYLYPQGERLKA